MYHMPLFSDAYIESLQSGEIKPYTAFRALMRRIYSLRTARLLDAIWVEKDALPWMPSFLENTLLPKNVPLVLDYDDAVFHRYDMHPNLAVRQLLMRKHQVLMRRATLVVSGNEYITDYACRAGASRVELLPTVVDLNRYKTPGFKPYGVSNHAPTVGWIGQRSTAEFLHSLVPLFTRLGVEGLMQFRAIGISASSLGLPFASEAWSEATEAESIKNLDVGVMPLNDGPFERGKCGYKLIQYMACGLPVVASPVGVNTSLVEHGVNGFLATSLHDWEWALRALAKDPLLRRRMGQAGRAKVEREYNLQVTAPILAGWLTEVARGKRG